MYGSANSITQWVQQVETARTPIIPDISIHKKPIAVKSKPLSRDASPAQNPSWKNTEKDENPLLNAVATHTIPAAVYTDRVNKRARTDMPNPVQHPFTLVHSATP